MRRILRADSGLRCKAAGGGSIKTTRHETGFGRPAQAQTVYFEGFDAA